MGWRWIWYDFLDVLEDIMVGFARLLLFVVVGFICFAPVWTNVFFGVHGWLIAVTCLPVFILLCWAIGEQ